MTPVKISIKEPCNEDWQKMTPKEQGRHCASCNKCVVDFTNFTDKEIFNYLAENRSQQTCGRFKSSQLERDINLIPKKKKGFPIYRLAASFFVGGLSLLSTKLMAQLPQVQEIVNQEEESNRARQIVISGSVRDIGTSAAIENASLMIGKDSFYSDSLGNYSFEYNGLDSSLTFLIEADGYVKKDAVISLAHLQ